MTPIGRKCRRETGFGLGTGTGGGEEIYLAGAAGHRAADRLAVQGSHALYGRGTDDADSHRVVHHASIRAAAHVSSFPRLSSILCGFSAVGF